MAQKKFLGDAVVSDQFLAAVNARATATEADKLTAESAVSDDDPYQVYDRVSKVPSDNPNGHPGAAKSVENAKFAAEGTDIEAATIGLTKSAKGHAEDAADSATAADDAIKAIGEGGPLSVLGAAAGSMFLAPDDLVYEPAASGSLFATNLFGAGWIIPITLENYVFNVLNIRHEQQDGVLRYYEVTLLDVSSNPLTWTAWRTLLLDDTKVLFRAIVPGYSVLRDRNVALPLGRRITKLKGSELGVHVTALAPAGGTDHPQTRFYTDPAGAGFFGQTSAGIVTGSTTGGLQTGRTPLYSLGLVAEQQSTDRPILTPGGTDLLRRFGGLGVAPLLSLFFQLATNNRPNTLLSTDPASYNENFDWRTGTEPSNSFAATGSSFTIPAAQADVKYVTFAMRPATDLTRLQVVIYDTDGAGVATKQLLRTPVHSVFVPAGKLRLVTIPMVLKMAGVVLDGTVGEKQLFASITGNAALKIVTDSIVGEQFVYRKNITAVSDRDGLTNLIDHPDPVAAMEAAYTNGSGLYVKLHNGDLAVQNLRQQVVGYPEHSRIVAATRFPNAADSYHQGWGPDEPTVVTCLGNSLGTVGKGYPKEAFDEFVARSGMPVVGAYMSPADFDPASPRSVLDEITYRGQSGTGIVFSDIVESQAGTRHSPDGFRLRMSGVNTYIEWETLFDIDTIRVCFDDEDSGVTFKIYTQPIGGGANTERATVTPGGTNAYGEAVVTGITKARYRIRIEITATSGDSLDWFGASAFEDTRGLFFGIHGNGGTAVNKWAESYLANSEQAALHVYGYPQAVRLTIFGGEADPDDFSSNDEVVRILEYLISSSKAQWTSHTGANDKPSDIIFLIGHNTQATEDSGFGRTAMIEGYNAIAHLRVSIANCQEYLRTEGGDPDGLLDADTTHIGRRGAERAARHIAAVALPNGPYS